MHPHVIHILQILVFEFSLCLGLPSAEAVTARRRVSQVADWKTLISHLRILKDRREIKYLPRTNSQNFQAMDKTYGLITPGGRSVILENPPFEADPTDFGGGGREGNYCWEKFHQTPVLITGTYRRRKPKTPAET